jgi:hypothetical protein
MMAQGLEGLQAEMHAMEERILAAIGDLRKDVRDDLSAIKEVLEVISEHHLAPDHQKRVKRTLASVGGR